MVILGSSQILRPSRVEGKLVHPRALVTTIPGSLKPDFRDPETENGNLETEKRVHRIQGTLETGLHKDPPQPGGPHKGGRRILFFELCIQVLPLSLVPAGNLILRSTPSAAGPFRLLGIAIWEPW